MNPFRHFVVICVRYQLSHIQRVIQILLLWTLYQLTWSKDREDNTRIQYGMEINIQKIFGVKRGSNGASPWITSVVCLPDDRIILADSGNPRILLYDQEGNLLNEISLHGKPRDMVLLDDHQLVMTFPNLLMIQFLHLEELKVTKTAHIGYECFGITRVADKLIVTCGTHLATLDVEGNLLGTTPTRNRSARYICSDDRHNIYFTGWEFDAIHCISSSGAYSIIPADSSLKYCRALVVHDDSLLVVGRWSHNICRFTLDGEQREAIVTKADGLDVPIALALSANKPNTFLITNNNGRSVVICEIVDPSDKEEKGAMDEMCEEQAEKKEEDIKNSL